MYAAAGGASIAKKNQARQQRQKNNALIQQGKLDKLNLAKATPPPNLPLQSRAFHQLPTNYLRTPNAQARTLSVGYTGTTQSKLLLPISESNQSHLGDRPVSPSRHHDKKIDRRRHIKKSATATLPLVSQAVETPSSTPTVCFTTNNDQNNQNIIFQHTIQINIPDPITITPATPLPSPVPPNQLERKCSVYRGRQLNAFEEDFYKSPTINNSTDEYLYNDCFYGGLPNGGNKLNNPDYCDSEHRHMSICTCDHIECAQGRAAWLERGRRCSVPENPASCHRRWVKRNRIHDSSLGGSSDDEDLLGVLRGPSSFANAFLYVGLGTIAIGLVIAFVGTGEKGFKTNELRLIGPSLIGIGLICCILRIFFCVCPSHCISSSRRARNKKIAKVDVDHTTSLLRADSKRVQIVRGPSVPTQLQRQPSKLTQKTTESIEALRQIATTSLFLQNEQQKTNRITPVIQEPENLEESLLEMKKIDSLSIDICSISDEEFEIKEKEVEPDEVRPNKLVRQRAPTNQQPITQQKDSDTLLMETSLMIINPTPSPTSSTIFQITYDGFPSTSNSNTQSAELELVLSPANLGQ